MTAGTRKIIFAGTARNVAPFLPGVIRNIETFSRHFAQWAVVVAENDSHDQTKTLLKAWMERAPTQGAARAVLADMDGMIRDHLDRTDRIALARNRVLEEIEKDQLLSGFDYLAFLDMDFPNVHPMRPENFAAAVDFLERNPGAAGVFPNQLPLYYDVWALREKDWCPRDCWDEVRDAMPALGLDAAVAKYAFERQRIIPPSAPPIPVESAFGGIGIYRMKWVLGRRYGGLKPGGGEVCEHVAFNQSIHREGGALFILPDFLNLSSPEHTRLAESHALVTIGHGPMQAPLLTRRDSRFALLRRQFPNFGENFAALAALHGRQGRAPILDLAPGAGEGLVLVRLHGCDSAYICVEKDALDFAVLSANALMQDDIFGDRQLLREFPDIDAGLVRLGTGKDGSVILDQPRVAAAPVLWARIEAPEEPGIWQAALENLPHENMMVFSASGALLGVGGRKENAANLVSLFQRLPKDGLDLVFFANSTAALFREFRGRA